MVRDDYYAQEDSALRIRGASREDVRAGVEKGDGAGEELDEAAQLRAQVKEELRRRAEVREQVRACVCL